MAVPNTLANGPGNVPDADELMENFDYLTETPSAGHTAVLAGAISVDENKIVTLTTAGNNPGLKVVGSGSRGGAAAFYSSATKVGSMGSSGVWLGTSASDFFFAAESGKLIDFYYNGGTNKALSISAAGAVAIRGTATNDAAAAGFVGEVVSSTVGTPTNFPTSNQIGDLTSISLTGGDWMVGCFGEIYRNGATVTDSQAGLGTASGNSGTGMTSGDTLVNPGPLPATTHSEHFAVSPRRYSLSGAQTLYFKLYATYSVATPQAVGRISAVRIR